MTAPPSAEPPATDDLDKAREELSDVTHFDDVVALVAKLRATVERQAREIADLSARLAGLEQYRARDKLAQRVLTAEAERDALRECVRELVACADESDSLAAERLYGKPHTPEYKTRELDHRQRSIEAWKAARAKVR